MPVSDSVIVSRLRAAGCVFAEAEARLLMSAARTPDELDAMVDRRTGGLPLELVLGWAEFCGLRITVTSGVFVPRRRTEFLVRQAAALARPGEVIFDLCCGAGAIAAALAAAVDRAEVHAADIDPAAVRCARQNVRGPWGHVYQGDLYEPLPAGLRGRVAVLVANVPYVPTEEIGFLPPEARAHEPRVALDGGADGLDVLRRVAAGAPGWLAPGGHLLIETSERQALSAQAAFAASGLTTRVASSDDLDATVVIGRFPADPESHGGTAPHLDRLGTPPGGIARALSIPVMAIADRAKSMAAIGVQLVKYILHLLNGAVWPVRGARRGFGAEHPPWRWSPGHGPERNRGHRGEDDNGQRNVRRHLLLHAALL